MARRIFTHARQFPHLIGKEDQEIREILRRGMATYPHYVARIRMRNKIVLGSMILAVVGMVYFAKWSIGAAMMLAGGIATTFVLAWNLVWVNTVVYRLTKEYAEKPK